MRRAYREALEKARGNVLQLGEDVENTLRQAIGALERGDVNLAATVLTTESDIHDRRRLVEQECMELIWRQQPVAGDLRSITVMREITTDLDRIGEYPTSIAKNALKPWGGSPSAAGKRIIGERFA
jgi:phosphate transport system protein